MNRRTGTEYIMANVKLSEDNTRYYFAEKSKIVNQNNRKQCCRTKFTRGGALLTSVKP